MSQNKAAWIEAPSAQLSVKEAPQPKAGPGEIVIKNAVVAVVSKPYARLSAPGMADRITRIPSTGKPSMLLKKKPQVREYAR